MNGYCMQVIDLAKYYSFHGRGTLKAVDGVNLAVPHGSVFGVVGESGCGKSTLGNCMMRLVEPSGGRVFFEGEDISNQPRRTILPKLRRMQMVFQNPYSSFNPKLKLSYSIREACRLFDMDSAKIDSRIDELLEQISLTRDDFNRFPHELSGGQLQRLAIARALLLDPGFIVADEPVSALDVSVQAQILNLIMDLRKVYGMTMLFISHDLTVVEHVCDEIAIMYLGIIVEAGKTAPVFSGMLHPYSRALMSATPEIDPLKKRESRVILAGDIPTAIDIPCGCRFHPRCPECMAECRESKPALVEARPGHFVACHLYRDGLR